MRILVFRPQPDAERTAAALAARGHEAVTAPLFTIGRLPQAAPEGAFAGIVVTSGNAVPALAEAPAGWRELPVFAVGSRTAGLLRDAGFAHVHSADGDRNALAAVIGRELPPPARLLQIAGRDRREDLPARLREQGYDIALWTAYAAEAVEALPETAQTALKDGSVQAALHYSPRGAETFLALAAKAGLRDEALALNQVALSADVAAPLITAGASTVVVAEHPEQAAMFVALDGLDGHADPVIEPAAPKAPKTSRSRRAPVTLDLAATPEAPEPARPAAEPAHEPEAVLPTEALPAEFTPPEAAEPARGAEPAAEAAPATSGPATSVSAAPVPAAPPQRALWPTAAVAGLAGGVIGAGIVLFALSRTTPAVDPAEIAALRSRIDGLQTAATAADRRAAAATEAAQVAGSEARANAARIAELAKAPAPAAVDTGAVAALAQRLDQTAARIGSVETAAKAAAAPSPQSLAAARIVLAERIRGAIASGRPFADDVAALASGGGSQSEIAALNAVATAGAPTRDALLVQFRGHRTLFDREVTPQSADWQARLMALASRVVTIRPVGDNGSNDPATLPLRLENAIAKADFGAASALWKQLPEPARRASADFGTSLQRRAGADAAIAKIAQDAVAALGKAG